MNFKRRAAFTLVELLVVIAIVGILIGMLLPAVQNVREAARRVNCMNRLRQVGLATIMFHDANRAFPPARLFPKKYAVPPYHRGESEPTWLVRILPFIEQENFYRRWNLSGQYDTQQGDIVSQPVESFICPSRRTFDEAKAPTVTQNIPVYAPCGCGGVFQVQIVGGATGDFAGNHGDLSPGLTGSENDYYYGGNGTGVIISSQALEFARGQVDWIDRITYGSITDGSSSTILAGELHVTAENLNKIPFNGPIYNGEDLSAFTRVGGPGVPIRNASEEAPTGSVMGYGSWHPGVCNFVFADGSTRSLSNLTDTVTLGQLCNRADGGVPVN